MKIDYSDLQEEYVLFATKWYSGDLYEYPPGYLVTHYDCAGDVSIWVTPNKELASRFPSKVSALQMITTIRENSYCESTLRPGFIMIAGYIGLFYLMEAGLLDEGGDYFGIDEINPDEIWAEPL